MIRRALLSIALLSALAHADIFVGPAPQGTGDCSSFANRCSFATGFAAFTSGTANTIHFDIGSYPIGFDVNKGGASPSGHLVLQCDAGLASATAAVGKCQVPNTISFANIGIFVEANNVSVLGFDVGNNPNMGGGIIGANANTSIYINGNYVHDLAQNVFNQAHATPPGPGCPENGAIGAGSVDIQTDGNFVKNFGVWPRDPNCRVSQGVYILEGQAYNNLVVGVPVGGIQVANACGSQVSNNTTISVAFGVIIENNNGCAGHNTVANNYVANLSSGGSAVLFSSNTIKCSSAAPNLFSHNIWDASSAAFFSAGPFSCDTVTPSPPIVQAGGSFFVNYQTNGSGDYHLKAGSAGIGAGASTCVSGGISPCVPSVDFSGTARPSSGAQDVGVYVATSGGVPIVNFAPSPLAYGAVQVSNSVTLTTTLSNTGSSNLIFSPASISGTNAGDFTILSTTCVSPLPAAASCVYSIRFTPSASGARAASLTLTDNASGSPHQVPLNGTGGAPGITLSPSSQAFGTVAPGSCSAVQSTTLTSSGSSPLTITAPFSLTGTNAAEFTSSGSCNLSPMNPGTSCQINFTFCPASAGAKSASLTIQDTAPGSPHSVLLSGTGGSSTATLTPATFNFGNQQAGTSSPTQNFTFTNTGSLGLTGVSVSLTGSTTAYAQTNNCGTTLASGLSCTIGVVFKPLVAGPLNASLAVASSATGSPANSALSGTGTASSLTLTPSTLNFGNVLVGTTSLPQTITLTAGP